MPSTERPSAYAEPIAAALATLNRRDVDTRDVEAWMRLENSTLDGLYPKQFRREVAMAVACIDASPADETRALRESYAL